MPARRSGAVLIPDNINLVHFEKNPERGPRILFFSGGSALRSLSRQLIHYTHNSIHIITAFDSGGSSAKLRKAFHMPAIGDVRARLMDLAEQNMEDHSTVFELFSFRFPKQAKNRELMLELDKMINGRHRLIARIPDPGGKIIRNHLKLFREKMPLDFDLRGASIGNLILTAGYLDNQRHLDPAINIFSKLVRAKGTVQLIANKYLHLAAELADGSLVVGQHQLTGKEVEPISSRITKIFLTADQQNPKPYNLKLHTKIKDLINEAKLICYPMGSFFSSILVNFLPNGVGKAIAANKVPKIYIPNTDQDPECIGMTVMDQVDAIVEYGRKDEPTITPCELVNFVLIDRKNGDYGKKIDEDYFTRQGIKLIDCPLISSASKPLIDENLLLTKLFTMC
jgi:CofD-related protein of GAK system